MRYSLASMSMKFVYINIIIFVVVKLAALVLTLCGINPAIFLDYLEMPSNLALLATRPWTVITYMFLHLDILHILFNMLWLYWFGALFLEFFNPRQFVGMYILGGIGGAALYLLCYNIFPYFNGIDGMMLGASASILAIVVATAVRAPNYKLNLLFLGAVSLKWIAIITIFIDFISIDTANAGGHIAHIGGAIVGAIYGFAFRSGRDITSPLNSLIDWFVNLFRRSSNVRIGGKRHNRWGKKSNMGKKSQQTPKQPSGNSTTTMSPADEAELDAILAKIKQSGYKALTAEEKKRLFEVSRVK